MNQTAGQGFGRDRFYLLLPSESCHVPAVPHFGKRYRAGRLTAVVSALLDDCRVSLLVDAIKWFNAVGGGDDASAFHAPRNASPMKLVGKIM
jgi:hypothetical protein